MGYICGNYICCLSYRLDNKCGKGKNEMNDTKRKPGIGEIYRQLDAAEEHIRISWHKLMIGYPEKQKQDPNTKGLECGTAEYHAAAAFSYTLEARRMCLELVPSDWQLCPYQDCCWGCGITQEGLYRCPHCGRLFTARTSDSEVEGWHFMRQTAPLINASPMRAVDFGPSWASPESETK